MTPLNAQDLFLSFQKAVVERAMNLEMSHHLAYKPGKVKPKARPTNATAPVARRC
jgi:transposase-like protein